MFLDTLKTTPIEAEKAVALLLSVTLLFFEVKFIFVSPIPIFGSIIHRSSIFLLNRYCNPILIPKFKSCSKTWIELNCYFS